jgi:NTP pyrophosphatase (non-canonical NTP hydrolase)
MNDELTLFEAVETVNAWLDASNPAGPHEDAMRLIKLQEEIGEVARAYIGMTGQNPRKGVTHDLNNLLDELGDVVVTALCAMRHFIGNDGELERYVTYRARSTVYRINLSNAVKREESVDAWPAPARHPG